MKPKTEAQIEVVKINNLMKETISVDDMNIIINKIEKNKKLNSEDTQLYFIVKEKRSPNWHVDRLYKMHSFHNDTGVKYLCIEILRNFKNDNNSIIFSKQRNCFNSYTNYDTFALGSEIELKSNNINWGGYRISDLLGCAVYTIKRHAGTRINCLSYDPKKLNDVIKIPYGETLYNQGEKMLVERLMYWSYKKEMLASIRIAKKHGFVFTEENCYEWFDMVYSIIKTKNDNHNPKFVAPENLNMMHNYFIGKLLALQRKQERIKAERLMIRQETEKISEIEREKKGDLAYIKIRRRFYGLVISNSKFDISVLKDIREFYEEGKAMQHCVFSMGYYKKVDSLIMSCRDKQGNRVETIEVNLNTFKVTQCYGKCDQFTEHHNEIVKLVENNMNKIRMCYKGKYKPKSNNLQIAI